MPHWDGEMLIGAEERIAYWGYTHLNISCRDINDEEELDPIGLERILYGVGFLAITNMTGINPIEEEDFAEEEEEEEIFDYEDIDSQANPFDYTPNIEEDEISHSYPVLDKTFVSLIDSDDEAASEDSHDFSEEPVDVNDNEQPTCLVLESEVKKAA